MPLPTTGPISLNDVRTELNIASQAPFKMNVAEMAGYTDLNNLSISASKSLPNIETPNSQSEWRGYHHTFSTTCSIGRTHTGLRVPYGYPYSSFAQINTEGITGTINYEGSNFANYGSAVAAEVTYVVYHSTYANRASDKIIKSGTLKSATPSDSLSYTYNSDSGSVITFLFGVPAPTPTPTPTNQATPTPTPTPEPLTTPLLKYDAYSSSYNVGTQIWSNVGSGGNTYDVDTGPAPQGTGKSKYIHMNPNATLGQIFYSNQVGLNLYNKSYAFSAYVNFTKWGPSSSDPLGVLFRTSDNSYYGFIMYTVATGNDPDSNFGYLYAGHYYTDAPASTISTSLSKNTWYHVAYNYNISTGNASMYLNNVLVAQSSITSTWNLTGTYPITIGAIGFYDGDAFAYAVNEVGVKIGSISFWTGSLLTPAQVTTLYQEGYSRYISS